MYDDYNDQFTDYCEAGAGTYHSVHPVAGDDIKNNCRIINNVNQSCALVNFLKEKYKLLSLGIYGCNLDAGGQASLMILATSDCCIFFFDLYECPRLMHDGQLGEIVESPDIVKVVHGSYCFRAVMQNVYKIYPRNIFDSQIVFKMLQSKEHNVDMDDLDDEPLNVVVTIFGRPMTVTSDEDFARLMNYSPNIWERRPLNVNAAEMAARNVVCLVPEVYATMCRYLPEECFGAVCKLMNPTTKFYHARLQEPQCGTRLQEPKERPYFVKQLQHEVDDCFHQKLHRFSKEKFLQYHTPPPKKKPSFCPEPPFCGRNIKSNFPPNFMPPPTPTFEYQNSRSSLVHRPMTKPKPMNSFSGGGGGTSALHFGDTLDEQYGAQFPSKQHEMETHSHAFLCPPPKLKRNMKDNPQHLGFNSLSYSRGDDEDFICR